MALLIMVGAVTAIQEQTLRRPFLLRISEREIRGLSPIFGAARKYGLGWIGQVILIGWKCLATLMVKLNYVLNKNSSFFLLQTLNSKLNSFPFKVIPLESNALSHPSLLHHYALLEELFWNAPQLYQYVLLDGLHAFKMGPLSVIPLRLGKRKMPHGTRSGE